MSEHRRRFLEDLHLPPDTSEYAGLQCLEEAMDQAYRRFTEDLQSPFVIFANLPPDEFEKHGENFPGRVDYSATLQLLILTMVSLPHEVAASDVDNRMYDKAKNIGIRRTLTFRRCTCTGNDRKKQADCSWMPRHRPPGRTAQWPSVALEVAYSESRDKVKKDMEYWLNQSDDVQMAISFEIKRRNGNIFITAWKPIQEIKICRAKVGQRPYVTGDNNLIIPFPYIMLRNPNSDQGEHDLVFTRKDLLEIADDVWDAMDNM
ncbi:hypothetical protein AJ80_00830 [Polytolypa hystricis UAMH7299]|uniref:Uncharacterized protein n=1 Tax=Polytolypa hystricis (strain UAMH7299) TaxID=1447883 RepID=A0A2B7Z385_POLH7|nr:hypothetical protein AJ80_00830 [Polytolypa hystricis UAMH7299]